MSWRETEVIKYLENAGFVVKRTNHLDSPGIPDFQVYHFDTNERFYLEVKSSKGFAYAREQKQLNRIKELISEGHTVRLARVEADYIKFEEFDSELNLIPLSSTTISAEVPIQVINMIVCPHCGYEWKSRVERPKRCPKCQKWLPEPNYEMRFVPYDENGKRKRGTPFIGDMERGYEDGQIVLLPLESRWESWWELVDEESVPKAEMERDQKKRDAFLVKADAAAALRAKQLARDDRPADIVA